MRRVVGVILAVLLCAACSEPPQKEIDQAQGALDAARAAGAEQYASAEYAAAAAALQEAHAAVADNDYRLALSRALDASQRAQEAARDAADGKAHARSAAESAIAEASAAVQQLATKIEEAGTARGATAAVDAAKKALAGGQGTLQEARSQLKTGRYIEAEETVKGLADRMTGALADLDDALKARPQRRRR